MQLLAPGFGLTGQPPVAWLGPRAAEALLGALLAVMELLVLPVAAATALGDLSGLL